VPPKKNKRQTTLRRNGAATSHSKSNGAKPAIEVATPILPKGALEARVQEALKRVKGGEESGSEWIYPPTLLELPSLAPPLMDCT
jgi:hypothetical protein